MRIKPLPSAECLRAAFSYCPVTGILRWKERSDVSKWVNTRFAGTEVGSPTLSGLWARLNNVLYAVHRVAYVIVEGDVLSVEDEIDHVDGNRFNNKWNNLRKANRAQNLANRDAQCNSLTGIKGVGQLPSGKFRPRLRDIHLGCFDTAEEAIEAYNEAAVRVYGEYGRLSSQQ